MTEKILKIFILLSFLGSIISCFYFRINFAAAMMSGDCVQSEISTVPLVVQYAINYGLITMLTCLLGSIGTIYMIRNNARTSKTVVILGLLSYIFMATKSTESSFAIGSNSKLENIGALVTVVGIVGCGVVFFYYASFFWKYVYKR